MAGVLTEDMLKENKFCVNCFIFNWKQPNINLLKRCTGCRMMWYCDDKCQKEHWNNTHKNQCKYLSSNKKALPNAKHKESDCLVCKDEARIGKDEMAKESNPILPCTMSKANKELMNIDEFFPEGLPYCAMAEMTGNFHTKVEAMIATFMRIMVKMKMTNHSLWKGARTAVLAEDLYNVLWKERLTHLEWAFTVKKPGPLEGQLRFDNINPKVTNIIAEKMAAIGKIRRAAEMRGIIAVEEFPSLFKPLKTLEILTGLLLYGGNHSYIAQYAADCLGIVGVPEEIERIRTTSVQSIKMRDSVLKLLSGGLVPYTNLVREGLCDGNTVQKCNVCMEEVSVRKADVVGISLIIPGDPVIVLRRTVTFSHCGSETCIKYIQQDPFVSRVSELSNMYITLSGEHVQEICDYCGRLNYKAKGLRCARCLTKLYCGVECQVRDTYHLQVKCEKGEKRKKKRGDSRRKEEGIEFARSRMGGGNV